MDQITLGQVVMPTQLSIGDKREPLSAGLIAGQDICADDMASNTCSTTDVFASSCMMRSYSARLQHLTIHHSTQVPLTAESGPEPDY